MSPRIARAIALSFLSALVLLALLSFDWRFGRTEGPPRLVEAFESQGPLKAGVGRAELVPPFPTPMGGYNTRGSAPFESVLDAPQVRALAFEAGGRTAVVVSVEVVLLPPTLRRAVLERLASEAPDLLVLTATHTHSGMGGYWDLEVAQWVGLGAYDPKALDFMAERVSEAVRQALGSRQPARLASGQLEVSNFGVNRARKNGPVDRTMSATRVETESGEILARLVVYAVHPTILHRDWMQLSGDWPGAFRRELESAGGIAMLLQGAVGDTTWGKRAGNLSLDERMERFGQAVASDAKGALVAAGEASSQVEMRAARVAFTVPAGDSGGAVWGPFEGLGSNLYHWLLWPGESEVSWLQVGELSLAFVPGEVVAELGMAWREALGGTSIVSLADDYLGYVESPDFVEREEGEAKRSYFGPELAPRLFEALKLAREGR